MVVSHTGVIVIGTGLAGLAAAIEARQQGAAVTILDKMEEVRSGGNSALAGGTIAVPTAADNSAVDDYVADFLGRSGGQANGQLVRTLAANVLDGVEWLRSLRVDLLPARRVAPYRVDVFQAAPGQFLGMRALLQRLRSHFVAIGGRIEFQTSAQKLLLDGRGGVEGVESVSPSGCAARHAKAVVLATGGFTASRARLKRLLQIDAEQLVSRGVSWATGDGLVMGEEAGAAFTGMAGLASLHVAAVSPDEPTRGIPDHAVPYCVAIGADGKRFHDESEGYVANGKALLRQPGQTAALVFDGAILHEQRVSISFETFKRLGLPVIEAATIEDLARQLHVPARALRATIDDYNAAVHDGRAPGAAPPKTKLAMKIAGPVFYAFYPLVPGVTSTFGGLKIDANARVCDRHDMPIAGLYAAGEVTGGFFRGDYIGGSSLANCLAMGRIAGHRAAHDSRGMP